MIPTLQLGGMGRILRSVSAGGDPDFASVVSLLPSNGADGSTTFTDVTGRAWTANGTAQIDTAQSKFGGSSALFDGTNGCFISAADSDDFYFSGDFSIEGWYRPAAIGTRQFLSGQGNGSASNVRSLVEITATGAVRFLAENSITLTTVTTISAGTWYWLQVTRSGSNYVIGIDGVSSATLSNATIPSNYAGVFAYGRCGDYAALRANGHMDDWRITKGVARALSLPTAPLPTS